MESSKKTRKAIKALLGDGAYKDETLDREFIAQKIFGDKKLLAQLNGIVHPAVRKDFLKWAKKQKAPYVIQESAIVFENGLQDFYDKVILVTAPEEIRIQRIVERDKTTKSSILARMGNQWDDLRKISLSDYVIHNISLDNTKSKVREVHGVLLDHSGL